MQDKGIMFLESLQNQVPSLAAELQDLAQLYDRKLWHQVTVKIEGLLELPELQKNQLLVSLYTNFIAGFGYKLNLLRLAVIAVRIAKQITKPAEAVVFLNGVIQLIVDAKQQRSDQPLLYLKMQIAEYNLVMEQFDECKKEVEEGKEKLEGLHDVDPRVSALVYFVASQYYKVLKNFAEFYKSSLLYLSYVSSDALDAEFKKRLAVDISLAALLGENVYNFGELLLHPIITVVEAGEFHWLYELLVAFNNGDMHAYDDLCARHAALLNSQPELVAHERQLRQKITVLCLMVLIFSLPAQERTVSLQTIADRTKLTIDGVEFLLMKSLSLHLIEGIIDQVEGTVQVSWVQPRVLTLPQIGELKGRLDAWMTKVNVAALKLEDEAVGVV